jgi:4-oxalomesaconate tautomerase
MLMRGGTSKGAYFLSEDLPEDARERDDLLLRIMGSPDPRQIDGVGGAHPLTSKVAIVGPSKLAGKADVDFLFAQVGVSEPLVDTTPNCGNILAGVGPFAIERGLVAAQGAETRVRVRVLNTETLAELVVRTPDGSVVYDGDQAIDGVPGTAAPIQVNFLDTAGSVCGGKLFPTGKVLDIVHGVDVTCLDNGMPVVLLRADAVGLTGYESCAQVEAAVEALKTVESIRIEAGHRMGLGDVGGAVIPKMCLIAAAIHGGVLHTRCLIPRRCHDSIGVFAAVSVATACVTPGTVANALARPVSGKLRLIRLEHPTGSFPVHLTVGGTEDEPIVESGGLMRTARALFDGVVFAGPRRAGSDGRP